MKKIYLSPVTEKVNVKLFGSILDDIGIVNDSKLTSDEALGKENNLDFEFDENFGDIWGDTDNNSNPYDLWGEN
jgi:hypothetical protein